MRSSRVRARPARELGDDDREDHRCGECAADPLQEAGADQQSLARRQAAERGGDREDGHAGDEDPLAAEQVAEAPGEQEEASEADQEGVDDPGEVGLA